MDSGAQASNMIHNKCFDTHSSTTFSVFLQGSSLYEIQPSQISVELNSIIHKPHDIAMKLLLKIPSRK